MKAQMHQGDIKIDFIQSKGEKKINENVTKSGNWVISHGKSQRNVQLCIKREGVEYKKQNSNRRAFLVM